MQEEAKAKAKTDKDKGLVVSDDFDFSKKELTGFQFEDKEWSLQHPRSMLLYDRGLGKTVICTKRDIDAGVGTKLVLGPNNSAATWEDHTKDWWSVHRARVDADFFHIAGNPQRRKRIWDELLHPERTRQHRIFFCSYGTALRDLEMLTPQHRKHIDQWDNDEAHRFRSRKSQLFEVLQKQLRHQPYFSMLTGTPVSRGNQEFWTYLNLINPRVFSSYWAHVRMFCEVIDGMWGKEIIGPRNQDNFMKLLEQHGRIRLKTDPEIAAQLPQKLPRKSLYVTMDADQQRMYDDLEMTKVHFTSGGDLVLAGTSMEAIMRFRQLLVCPRIFDPSYSLGAAFNDFLDEMKNADAKDRHTVLFCPFKGAFPHFREALLKHKIPVNQLTGGISKDEQRRQIAEWRANQGVMLNSIRYAESYSLEPAGSSYFVGYEWDPNWNSQAEDRLLRLTTRYPVQHHYYRYQGTIDDGVCNTVNWKGQAIHASLNAGRQGADW